MTVITSDVRRDMLMLYVPARSKGRKSLKEAQYPKHWSLLSGQGVLRFGSGFLSGACTAFATQWVHNVSLFAGQGELGWDSWECTRLVCLLFCHCCPRTFGGHRRGTGRSVLYRCGMVQGVQGAGHVGLLCELPSPHVPHCRSCSAAEFCGHFPPPRAADVVIGPPRAMLGSVWLTRI